MKKKTYESEGLYRFKIIAPLVNEVFAKGELKKQIEAIAKRAHEHPERGYERFKFKTIQEWYYLYRRFGLSALERRVRHDHGKSRSIGEELGELIVVMKKENPRRSARQIIKELCMAGRILPGELSPSSVYRLLSGYRQELSLHQRDTTQKKRFAFAYANACWQSDVSHGPYLGFTGSQKKKKIYLIALLDDASRLIPHIGIFHEENLENFLEVLKTGILKRGIPDRLYLDNASYYRTPLVKTIGARLGMKVIYCTPFSPQKKGKIERFWLRLKREFMSHLRRDQKYTLEELNRLVLTWVEKDYHHEKHTTLKKTPLVAWTEKSQRIRYPDAEMLEKDFLAEDTRKVRRDGSIPLKGKYYDVDSLYAGEKVTVRYNPFQLNRICSVPSARGIAPGVYAGG